MPGSVSLIPTQSYEKELEAETTERRAEALRICRSGHGEDESSPEETHSEHDCEEIYKAHARSSTASWCTPTPEGPRPTPTLAHARGVSRGGEGHPESAFR